MLFQGQVGPQQSADGTFPDLRMGRTAEGIVQELHGRFFEQCFRGNVYRNGMTVTALSANTITLTATTTPILGVWNPSTSPVNIVILQAVLQIVYTAAGTVDGVKVWATSLGNNAITTGSNPFNCKTLANSGSFAKGMAFQALTGLTNNLVIQFGAGLNNVAQTGTAQAITNAAVENFDGSLIIPPGGVLALLNTTSTTAVSASGYLLWEEVPI